MKVFVVEDSEVVLNNLMVMLSGISGVEIIGSAEDEVGAIERIDSMLPDVVTLDLHLKTGSGLNVLAHIKKYHPSTIAIVLSNYINEFYIDRCKRYGADYFLDKSFQFMAVKGVMEKISSTGKAEK